MYCQFLLFKSATIIKELLPLFFPHWLTLEGLVKLPQEKRNEIIYFLDLLSTLTLNNS